MKTKTIEARQIGYMVEWKNGCEAIGEWVNFQDVPVRTQKGLAIGEFTRRCKFIAIPEIIRKRNTVYRWLKYRGLARCVPVYVEVKP